MNKRIINDVATQAASKIVERYNLDKSAWGVIALIINAAIRLAVGVHRRLNKRLHQAGGA